MLVGAFFLTACACLPHVEHADGGTAQGVGSEGPGTSWKAALPRSPFRDRQSGSPLFPALAGDLVLVNTSFELLALDIETGTLAWRSGDVPGWTGSKRVELVRGVDFELQLVAPAAGAGVAVAALQVPVSSSAYTDFQGIRTTVPIPERRLHAFDLDTGVPLWDHAPPLDWDGESGLFSTRMTVVAPPTIFGSSIFVLVASTPAEPPSPLITLHAACFDARSGKTLWTREVASAPAPLNRFGRHELEFSGAPLRVDDGRVFALTQMGSAVALTLEQGEILWKSTYETTPLPKSRGRHAQRRLRTWRNSPVVLAQGVVIVAPTDSPDLTAFDADDGETLWTHPVHSRHHDEPPPDTLLGANRETVYLGGGTITALRKPDGLRSKRPFVEAWASVPVDDYEPYRSPRAILAENDLILVPGSESVRAIRAVDGEAVPASARVWRRRPGNLAQLNDILVSLSAETIARFPE